MAGLPPPSLGNNFLTEHGEGLLIVQVEKPRPGCVHLCMPLTKPYRKTSCKATLRMTGQGFIDSQGRPRACWLLRLERDDRKVSVTSAPHFLPPQSLYPLPCFPGHKWQLPVPESWGLTGGKLESSATGYSVACQVVWVFTILDPDWAPRLLCSNSSSDS